MHDTTPARTHRCTRVDAICVLLLIAYFLHFALAARHGGFREDEMLNLWAYLVRRSGSITLRPRQVLDTILPAGRRALLSTSLSFFRVRSFSLSDRPNWHPRSVNPDRLLSGPTSRLFPPGRFSCGSCFLLPSVCSEPGIRWCVHLRRVMRPLLFCCIDLLHPYPGETGLPSPVAASAIPGAIRLCTEQQGDGGHTSRDRFDL